MSQTRTPPAPSTGAKTDESRPNGTLLRGLEVLKAFQPGHAELGNADIAAATRLPKPTVSRLTQALVEAGYLEQVAGAGTYRLRPRVLTLGFSLLSNCKVLPLAHERMQQLADTSGCVVSLASGDTHEMIYLDRCGGSSMPYFFSVGSAVEMARTAIGRAYLAGLSPAARQSRLDFLAQLYGADWPPLLSEIEKAAEEVSERGFCLVDQSWRRNIRSIAAPLTSRDKSTVLAIGCVTPAHAMTGNQLTKKWGAHLYHIVDMLAEHL